MSTTASIRSSPREKSENLEEKVEEVKEGGVIDGGLRAWLVIVGAVCNNAATWGLINSWGVFQAYYETNILPDVSPSPIAWIGSIQYALVFLPGLLVGRMFDLGYHKMPLLGASALFILATFLTAECTQYWHFLLCQGILSCGTIYGPTMACVPQWWNKRLGLVLGIVAVGSSIGGTVFPIVSRLLIPVVGFKWTMRILGFILLLILGVGNLTVTRRVPPVYVPGGLWNLKAFKSKPYTLYCLSGLVAFLGLYTVLTYIAASTNVWNTSDFKSFYLVAIANAASGVARLIFGRMSDHTGALNLMIPTTACAAILTVAWPFARSIGSIIIVAILYGFASGTYICLLVRPIIAMGDNGDVGRRLGMFTSIIALGALTGPPISGAINHATGGYEVVGYYAGGVILLAVGIMGLVRYLILGKMWGKI
ncbi:MFS general substrate transporter [Crepidotus variabilis]|uniref:MFS general substrate transporter n=1 Tax=Crepidotus variabilis TaxID=179855 RepID=A0A9P6JJK0_9AGAR|nr:MFS general substrate transporter [Crepidotus variabilis]